MKNWTRNALHTHRHAGNWAAAKLGLRVSAPSKCTWSMRVANQRLEQVDRACAKLESKREKDRDQEREREREVGKEIEGWRRG